MAITLSDLPELLRLLEQHPEWRQALRLILLGEELLQMPHLLQQLITVQQHVLEVLQRHEQQIAELIRVQQQILETQQRHEQQIAELIRVQQQILETQQRHEQQIAELIRVQQQILETQQRHEQQIAELIRVQQQILETQQRHEQQIAELIQVQRQILETQQRHEATLQRHEQQIAELIRVQQQILETQQRHEATLQRHEEILTQVLEVQRQHSETLAQVLEVLRQHSETLAQVLEVQQRHTRAIDELRSYVGNLTQSLGLSIEENAEDMLLYVMEKKGWKLVQGPNSLSTDGELDLIAVFEDAAGQLHTVLMEVKMRLSRSAVEQWSDRMRSEGFLGRLRAQGFEPPFYPYLFGFRVDVAAEEAARARQVGLITPRGERAEPTVLL